MSDAMVRDGSGATMPLRDPEAASKLLREFLALLDNEARSRKAGGSRAYWDEIHKMKPLIEDIARVLDPQNVGDLSVVSSTGTWKLGPAHTETLRLIGKLERREDYERVLGPTGPTLAANRLHPWVWHAAASLWDGGHFGPAVQEAAKAVALQTQLKVGRRDQEDRDLYAQAFSLKEPKVGASRLRFSHVDEGEQPKTWISAHEGAMYLGMGCAQGIRNPQAHPSHDLTEQEALEQLAALSVLARWVDECKVDSGGEGAAGE